MKKTTSIALCAALAAATPAFSNEIAQAAELKKSSSHLAAQLVIDKLRDDVAAKNDTEADLTRILLSDPQRYQSPDEAKKLLAEKFNESLRQTFRRRVGALLDRMARPKSREEFFGKEFLDKTENPGDAFITKIAQSSYSTTYSSARKKACETQAKQLSASIIPTEREVDSMTRNALIDNITQRIVEAKKNAIFAENIGHVKGAIAGPIVDEAFRQREEQRKSYSTMALNTYTPAFIETNMLRNIAGEVARIQKECRAQGKHAYLLFPSTTNCNFVAHMAKERAVENLVNAVNGISTNLFNPNWAEREIVTQIDKHRARHDSESHFRRLNAEKIAERALHEIKQKIGGAEKKAFDLYFEETGSRASKYANRLNERASREFWPLVAAVRNACAEKQLKQYYKPLAEQTWYPGYDIIDIMSLNPDFHDEVRNWRKHGEFSKFAEIEKKEPVISETSDMVNKAMEFALYAGGHARRVQHNIVQHLYQPILKYYEEQSTRPTLEAVVNEYEKRVIENWMANAAKELRKYAVAAPHFEDLFGSTREQIELRAKAIVSMAGASTTVSSSGGGAEEVEVVPCSATVTFDIKNEKSIETLIRVNGQIVSTVTANLEKKAFRRELDGFARKVSDIVSGRIRDAAKNHRLNVRLNIIVKDSLVYYGAVIDVYDNICADIEKMGPKINSFKVYGAPRN